MENVLINWTAEYSVKNSLIDNQHKELVKIINELYSAFKVGEVEHNLLKLIDRLYDYTVYHFGTEEKLLQQAGYENFMGHQLEHQHFTNEIREFKRRASEKDLVVSYEIMIYLREWLIKHILKSDKLYVPYLKDE